MGPTGRTSFPSLQRLTSPSGENHPLVDHEDVAIGSAADSTVRLDTAGVVAHHAVLEWREGGWWLRPLDGVVELNGLPLHASARLRDRDQIGISHTFQYEFASGEPRTRRMGSAADMIARPRKRRYGRLPGPGRNVSIAALMSVAIAVVLVGAAVAVAWYGTFRATRSIAVLNDRQAAELDSLLGVAYDHVERGGTLLELGLGEGAGHEFAQAVTTLELSDLRNDALVKPRIQALAASVAAIYRERSLSVPRNYADATAPLTPEQIRTASLSTDQFAAAFALMDATFQARFGHPLVVSGRDHAEHVALYGRGGAMDLSIKTMNPVEVAFVINQSHGRHIRIKDFSQDSVLRREVQSAVRAGLLFEAGTGLHLHMDRFANRHDKWTTLRFDSLQQGSRDLAEARPTRGIGLERRHDRWPLLDVISYQRL